VEHLVENAGQGWRQRTGVEDHDQALRPRVDRCPVWAGPH
jgi:hypothetical protein